MPWKRKTIVHGVLDKKWKLWAAAQFILKACIVFFLSNPTVMDICDSCLYTSSNEILEMAVHSNGAPYSVSTSLLLVFTFLHLIVYCLCVEEMKLVFRVIVNMNAYIYHVLTLRQENTSICSPSFPVSNRKFTVWE